ncbi:hypothetical protein [Okeania sp. SIO1I7]|uniref:TRAFAC clade GTPase domain-containing protein n=1 Tax=Okeania sp. SIO1I7 TaxID=2607772 RepID=UPI0013FB42B5|nr:hypothetical protein [Okeania sp. SIO1I7]NET24610.1 hypothetical protein [Okeania sp. SIO1I7]
MFNTEANETVNEPVNKPSPKPQRIPSQIRLGIWGFPGAGKSVYMLRLSQELSDQGRLVPTDEITAKYIYEGTKLLEKGEFVNPTGTGKYSKYSYTIENSDNRNIELTFFDLPGEVFTDPENYFSSENNREVNVVDYLLECHGILFLLSPLEEDIHSFDESYYILLKRLFDLMRIKSRKNRLEQYVAFGITKIDNSEVYGESLDKYAEQMFLNILGRGPNAKLTWLKNYFHIIIEGSKDRPRLKINPTSENRCQFFYISAFGIHKDSKGNVQYPVRENKEEKPKYNTYKTEEDPMFPTDDLEDVDVENFGNKNNDTEEFKFNKSKNKYIIDTKVRFNPINMYSPIEWLIKGIKEYPPNIPDHSSADSNT